MNWALRLFCRAMVVAACLAPASGRTSAEPPIADDNGRETSPDEWELEPTTLTDTFRTLRAGPIWVSSQPGAAALLEVKQAGVTDVISLRSRRELNFDDVALVREAGLRFQPLRFGGHQELTDELLDEARRSLSAAADERQILLHCASGNRVGAVWIAYRVLDAGKPLAAALNEARQIGLVDPDLRSAVVDYVRRHRDGAQD
ncbi:MAG: hypothetical protein AAF670_01545 [Planctomycetota bacterium]